jgi:polar amino acid transport system permease protein
MSWNWQFTWEILPTILGGLVVTLQAVAGGMVLALILGLIWAVLRRMESRWIRWPIGGLLEFIRGTPLLVQLYFVYYGLGPAIGLPDWPLLIGILVIGVHYSCYTAEVYRAGIEGVPRGQWEASVALNLTRYQTYTRVVLPQAVPPVIPALGNYLIAMFKDTPLLAAISVGEILRRAQEIGGMNARYLEPLTIVGIIYLILSLISGFAVTRLRDTMHLER